MKPSAGRCNGCGECCQFIHVGWHKVDLSDDDVNIVLRRIWKRTSRAAAEVFRGCVLTKGPGAFYNCTVYQPETRRCGIQDTKPLICSGFPWYPEGSDRDGQGVCIVPHAAHLTMYWRCGYWLDIPRDQWPAEVDVEYIEAHAA